jgi:phospholipase/carboxylesterase
VSAPAWVERTVGPRVAAPDGRPPLLVLLHGIGADERDLLPLAPALDPRLLVVGLRAPHRYQVGHAWFQIDFRLGGIVPDVAQARRTLVDLVAWLEAAPGRLGADERRLFLLGFSQGAMMSLGVLLTAPERLAGVVALSGRSPEGLFEMRVERQAVARVPVLAAHGTRDDVLPVAEGRRIRDGFTWLQDFTYREFPVAHGISDDEVALVADWLGRRL